MRRRTILGLVVAATTVGLAAPAFAQPRERERERGEREREMGDHREGPDRRADRGRGEWEREVHGREFYGARGPEWHRGRAHPVRLP